MKRVEVYQAMWGMEDLPKPSEPYSIEKKLDLIAEADFDGVLNYIDSANDQTLQNSYDLSKSILEKGLKLGLSCHGYGLDDIKSKIDYAKSVSAEFLNIMVKDYTIYGQQAVDLLEATVTYSKNIGVKVFIETHRGTVTQDLIRAVDYVDKISEMELTIDISHYIVAGEIIEPDQRIEQYFDKLFKRSGSIHLRISNGEQVQVSLKRAGDSLKERYMTYWKKAIECGMKNISNDEAFPVIVELGPEDYHQKVFYNGEYVYDGDRWQEALEYKALIEDMIKAQ